MAYTSLKYQILGNFASGTLDGTTTFQDLTLGATSDLPALKGYQLSLGTTAGKANLWSKPYTGTLVGTADFDLTALLDPYGATINFAKVKAVLVVNYATTAAYNLTLGLGTNPWLAPFGGVSTSKMVIGPGFLGADGTTVYPNHRVLNEPSLAGYAVSPTSKVIRLDSGANSVPYLFWVLGTDA